MRDRVTIEIEVMVPAGTNEAEVADCINAALDEPPCDWTDWAVGAAIVKSVVSEDAEE